MADQTQEQATILWEDVVQLAREGSDPTVVPWIERLVPVSFDGSTFLAAAKQRWTEQKVMTEYKALIEGYIQEITLEHADLVVVADAKYFAAGAPTTTQARAQAQAQASREPSRAMVQPVSGLAPTTGETTAVTAATQAAGVAPGVAARTDEPTPPAEGMAHVDAGLVAAQTVRDQGKDPARTGGEDLMREGAVLIVDNGASPDGAADEASRAAAVTQGEQAGEAMAREVGVATIERPRPSARPAEGGIARYTFDTFVVGEANRIAYEAARSVAEGDVVPYNPLFLYSKPGLGKTHLLFAIYNYISMYRPDVKVRYATSSAFVEQYVDEIHNKKLTGPNVVKEYREVDVLLVDDVQFFRRKQDSVSMFFDIFNQLMIDGKHIVLTADEAPDYLDLDERVKQRFGMGGVIDIAMPSHDLKVSILRYYYQAQHAQASWLGGTLSDSDLDYIAEISPNSIREMQSFLNRVLMEVSRKPSQPLTYERIRAVRDELFKTSTRVEIPLIIDVVADEFGVAPADITGKRRTKAVSEARQVTMWLARQLTDESYQSIGNNFDKDHSTVIASIKKITEISQADREYLYKLEQLKKKIVARNT